jgi:hypothetical protein
MEHYYHIAKSTLKTVIPRKPLQTSSHETVKFRTVQSITSSDSDSKLVMRSILEDHSNSVYDVTFSSADANWYSSC